MARLVRLTRMSMQKVHATSGADAEIEAARMAGDKRRALTLLMARYGAGILLVECGDPDPHRDTCVVCRREHKAREELIRELPLVGGTTATDEPAGILDRDLGAVVSAGGGYRSSELSVRCSCHPSSTQDRQEIAYTRDQPIRHS